MWCCYQEYKLLCVHNHTQSVLVVQLHMYTHTHTHTHTHTQSIGVFPFYYSFCSWIDFLRQPYLYCKTAFVFRFIMDPTDAASGL